MAPAPSTAATALERARARREAPKKRAFRPPPAIQGVRELGRRMKEVRLAAGASQSQLARYLDLAKQTISNWENAASPPQIPNLLSFCSVLGVAPSQLFKDISEDVTIDGNISRRLSVGHRLLPVYRDIDTAGTIMLGTIDRASTKADYIATLTDHPPEAVAFVITSGANEPRFAASDVVTILPQEMAGPGTMVLAVASGRFVFRKFLPREEGRIDGAVLRPLNPDHPDIEMHKGDRILGALKEHTSTRR